MMSSITVTRCALIAQQQRDCKGKHANTAVSLQLMKSSWASCVMTITTITPMGS